KDFQVTGTAKPGMGFGPPGGRPGFGGPRVAPVTGATADKVKAAALAKYPGSKVERIDKLPDGSYIAHVLKSDGSELHVTVSKDFQVTGTAEERGFGPPGGHPGGRMPPPPPGSNGRPMRPQAGPPPAPPGGSNS
ncbi:MAG: hypothetical protein QOC95_2511, partial [Thermoleophilaceae bacterium]|nr:hypothetical protein [Thermoleophilaceae bacterium]